jgi:hypothetical protein
MQRVMTKPGYRVIAEAFALVGGITCLTAVLSVLAVVPG